MKFFSVVMLASSLMVASYSYASERNWSIDKGISVSADSDINSIKEINYKAHGERVSFKKFDGNDGKIVKQLKRQPTGPYNDLTFDDLDDNDKENTDVAITCESWCCATITSVLVMSLIFSKQVGEVLLDKKNN